MKKDDPDCNGAKTEACPWDSLDARCGRQGQGLCLDAVCVGGGAQVIAPSHTLSN